MVLEAALRLVLPAVLVAGLVLVVLPRSAGRLVGTLVGRTAARRSERARRLSRIRGSISVGTVAAAVVGAKAAESALIGGAGVAGWVLAAVSVLAIVAG